MELQRPRLLTFVEPPSCMRSISAELASLATELNQPDLMYKFMSLAAVSAAWNTRKGAAFGFAAIAAKAGEQVRPLLTDETYQMFTSLNFSAAHGDRTLPAPSVRRQLKPYLPRLIPKLYRYLHDPSPKVNAAMTAIWNALVPDRNRALEEHFNAILTDLVGVGRMTRSLRGTRAAKSVGATSRLLADTS